MSEPAPRPRSRPRLSEKKNGTGSLKNESDNAKKKGEKGGSSGAEIERLNAIYKQYLESSDDESELSIDAWEEGEYEIDKIVDEMVDMCGDHKFQVQWKGWKRKSDGTSTTWVKPALLAEGAAEVLEEWTIEKKRRIVQRRRQYAETGYPLSLFLHGCFTRFNTTLEELGLGLDQQLTPDMEFPSYIDKAAPNWDKEIEETKALALAHMPRVHTSFGTTSSRMDAQGTFTEFQEFESSPLGSQATPLKLRRPPSDTTQYATPMDVLQGDPVFLRDSSKAVQSFKRQTSPELSLLPSDRAPKRRKKGKERGIESDRTLLQDALDRATERNGAARVVLVNEVDDELIPASINLDTFKYIEHGPYRHDGDLPSHADFLTGCMCEDGCSNPALCHCQDEGHAEMIWEGGKRVFAYDKNRKYRFPRVSVTECNDNCRCNLSCPNRVAQQPRDVPLEIFKTRGRGWGVRATTFIEKGEVLGTFTGDLVPSSKEDAWVVGRREGEMDYELDWFNGPHRWKVTAKDSGNWSRFLNHSCYPNLMVYAVLYDSIMNAGEDNRHRLGFVALEDIEPRTELTIDYTPQHVPAKGEECCEYGGCKRVTRTRG